MTLARDADKLGLPVRVFLYHLDQIATMLDLKPHNFKIDYVHYEGRSVGPCPPGKMVAKNIAPEGEKPEWRIPEYDLVKWMKSKGITIYQRGI